MSSPGATPGSTLARLATAWLILIAVTAEARSQTLVADLSSHLIAITAGFTGTEVLLFGATEGEGEVIVVVRGPESEVTVRRKRRTLGIWVNRGSITFEGVPSFYAVASSRPLAEIVQPEVLSRQQIGVDNLQFQAPEGIRESRLKKYHDALIRNKQRAGLFSGEVGQVTFLGERLFRTEIYFPANVPTGSYLVEVLLVRDGEVVSAQTSPLIISKIGIGAEIFDFAHNRAALYGVLAIIGALMAGWSAHLVFRRV
ncbi:TIGR02186 family protein [Rhodospirillaceae bacterium SYSU D60014]|uniref:TIGR02186 family protein n=1 Tax=Virgifigura deserti TaxID=2268457 RepID=UPI000E66D1E4